MSNIYYPDAWSILLFKDSYTNEDIIKVFAVFYGNYLYSTNWKLSSGTIEINKVSLKGKGEAYKNQEGYELKQFSGSSYIIPSYENPPCGLTWITLESIVKEHSAKVITIEGAINILYLNKEK